VKVISFFLTLSLLTACLTGCSKEDNSNETLQQRIQGEWNFQKATEHTHNNLFNPADTYNTINGATGDYFDFRNDGKLYSKIHGYPDTIQFAVLNETQFLYDSDTATVLLINDNAFNFYVKGYFATGYYEYTNYLVR